MLIDIGNRTLVNDSVKFRMRAKRGFDQRGYSCHRPRTAYETDNTKCRAYVGYKMSFRTQATKDLSHIGLVKNSYAIPLKSAIVSKVGRPRKHSSEKRRKLQVLTLCTETHTVDQINEDRTDKIQHGSAIMSSTTLEAALDVVERRRKSIKSKVMQKKENQLTFEEEQDIHTRADIYAITSGPDPQYYILPEENDIPFTLTKQDEICVDTTYPLSRKKRRRNYGNTNCYVHSHNTDDVYDNTKKLPIGTRLLKPHTKLVELVAQAISGSPDGLLQVQQIYIFLQNRYPFFRYMERSAINSWRSSIRHALYQKWFRKIKFDASFISNKGCYWSINHKSHPKEWTLPESQPALDSDEEMFVDVEDSVDIPFNSIQTSYDEEYGTGICILDGVMIDDQCVPCPSPDIDVENLEDRVCVPSPVKEPDPILATCGPDWNTDDLCLSSPNSSLETDRSSTGSPPCIYLEKPSLVCGESPGQDLHPHFLLGTPFSSPTVSSSLFLSQSDLGSPMVLSSPSECQSQPPSQWWLPDWEETASFFSAHDIASTKNCAPRKCVSSLGNRLSEPEFVYNEMRTCGVMSTEQGLLEMIHCIEDSMLMCDSDTNSDLGMFEYSSKSACSSVDIEYFK